MAELWSGAAVSVYVDELRYHPVVREQAKRYGYRWCHMFADTLDELHAFAGSIGCRRGWFQGDHGDNPHYDLTPTRRERAVKAGAGQINLKAWLRQKRLVCGREP